MKRCLAANIAGSIGILKLFFGMNVRPICEPLLATILYVLEIWCGSNNRVWHTYITGWQNNYKKRAPTYDQNFILALTYKCVLFLSNKGNLPNILLRNEDSPTASARSLVKTDLIKNHNN